MTVCFIYQVQFSKVDKQFWGNQLGIFQQHACHRGNHRFPLFMK